MLIIVCTKTITTNIQLKSLSLAMSHSNSKRSNIRHDLVNIFSQKTYLLEEKMVSKVVQDHGVCRINGICLWQHLNARSNWFWLLLVKLQNRKTNKSSNTLCIQLQSTFKRQSGTQYYVDVPNKKLNPFPLTAMKETTSFLIPQSQPYKAEFPVIHPFPSKQISKVNFNHPQW